MADCVEAVVQYKTVSEDILQDLEEGTISFM